MTLDNLSSRQKILIAAGTLLIFSASTLSAQTTTIFAPGVSADSGWYDVNKKSTEQRSTRDFNLCWAAAASNMLQYWQNEYTATGHTLPSGTPTGVGTKNYDGLGAYELEIFEKYLDYWGSEGSSPDVALRWYFTGESHNISGSAKPQEGTGGFLSEIYDDVLSACGSSFITLFEKYGDNAGWAYSSKAHSTVSANVLSILEKGVGSVIIKPGTILHSITLWGAEFDENNLLKALYITDSDDAAKSGYSSPLRRYEVGASTGLVQLLNTDYGNVEITQLYGLTAYPIPEPSGFGLFAGAIAAIAVSYRRRRR